MSEPTDRYGRTLGPGDPVLCYGDLDEQGALDPDGAVPMAMVLLALDGQWLIQIDQRDPEAPRHPLVTAALDQRRSGRGGRAAARRARAVPGAGRPAGVVRGR